VHILPFFAAVFESPPLFLNRIALIDKTVDGDGNRLDHCAHSAGTAPEKRSADSDSTRSGL
jgi:hypothetical protein